jgi:hypothetical protein
LSVAGAALNAPAATFQVVPQPFLRKCLIFKGCQTLSARFIYCQRLLAKKAKTLTFSSLSEPLVPLASAAKVPSYKIRNIRMFVFFYILEFKKIYIFFSYISYKAETREKVPNNSRK